MKIFATHTDRIVSRKYNTHLKDENPNLKKNEQKTQTGISPKMEHK